MSVDSGVLNAGENSDGKLNWQDALAWAESLEYAGYADWRLPNAKELQSIVDYTRCLDTTNSAAIDPMFALTSITNDGGGLNYPFYWTSTTHKSIRGGSAAVYIAFGEALGWMKDPRSNSYVLMDVHGAGAQRSDPKAGDSSEFTYGRGPQGDVVRITNFVLCVRSEVEESIVPVPNEEDIGSGQKESGNPFIDRRDQNGDNKVSIDEYDGFRQQFRHLDRNNDGFITADETHSRPMPKRNKKRPPVPKPQKHGSKSMILPQPRQPSQRFERPNLTQESEMTDRPQPPQEPELTERPQPPQELGAVERSEPQQERSLTERSESPQEPELAERPQPPQEEAAVERPKPPQEQGVMERPPHEQEMQERPELPHEQEMQERLEPPQGQEAPFLDQPSGKVDGTSAKVSTDIESIKFQETLRRIRELQQRLQPDEKGSEKKTAATEL